ncbi:Peptidase family M23 [Dyella sp. OK004]|nr:Peptidase family M23 [Dyella sp. OK004]
MPYQDVMNTILPRQGNHSAHITGHYGEHRANGPHGGSDFNYEGGQQGANLEHPTVHSPVAGVVTFVGGQYGTIKIRDAEGNSHEILHTQSQSVTVGQRIETGDVIGAMGGRGPHGATQYAQHVHYQMKDSQGHPVNPETFWAQRTHDAPIHPPARQGTAIPSHPDSVVRHGSQGETVRALQRELAELGYEGRDGKPLKDDAHFGPDTRHAVEAFQRTNGLKIDGLAGPQTLEKLSETLRQRHAQMGPAPLLNDSAHPDHAMYRQALDGVHKLDAQHGRTPDMRSEQLAAALTVSAKQEGLSRIDLVVLGTNGEHVFAAQGLLDSPFKRVASVPTTTGLETPMAFSSQQWEKLQQSSVQQTSQPHQQAQQQSQAHTV